MTRDPNSTTAPTGAVRVSPRQQRWLDAADKAAREGDDLAAGLFVLIAQPNRTEKESAK